MIPSKQLVLDEQEMTQFYVLAAMFAQNGELQKDMFTTDGPARTLARKLQAFLADYSGPLTIGKP